MIDLIGYAALILSLCSMTTKNVLKLRVLHGTANLIYLVYAVLLDAIPLIIGCTIMCVIQLYHIRKLLLEPS